MSVKLSAKCRSPQIFRIWFLVRGGGYVLNIFIIFVVSPETEEIIYTDDFFRCKNIIVNALDNVEARRYVDRQVNVLIS